MMLEGLISHVVGVASQNVQVPRHPAVAEAVRFLGALQSYVFGPWLQVAKQGHVCRLVPGCDAAAISTCGICEMPACPRHVFVSAAGEVVCKSCVFRDNCKIPRQEQPRKRHPTPPPSNGGVRGSSSDFADEMMKHLNALRLKPGATKENVRRAYKQQAKECHPDRAQEPLQKEFFERRLREINAAKDWLLENMR